jgi:alpha-1,6-mannosyltransferase
VGRGSQAAWFTGFKHPRFAFLGFVDDPARMRGLYDGHDILLAPGPYETFGLGVLEAMARGMAVVGPDRGGTAELLRQAKSRFIFETGNLNDFLHVLERAIETDRGPETERTLELSRRYGTWDDAIGRMISRYSSRLGAKPV